MGTNCVGYGYHGDFIEAWETGVLQRAIDQCTNLSGNQRDCPVFTFSDAPGECEMESPLPALISKENVLGPRKGLPNGLQVQPGPEQASKPGSSNSDGYAPAGKPIPKAPPRETTPVAKVPTVAVSTPHKHPSATSSDSYLIGLTPVKNDEAQVYSSSSTLLPPIQVNVADRTSTLATSSAAPLASSVSPTTTCAPASSSSAQLLQQGPVYTSYYTSGREVHEVILYVTEVTVTAEVPYAKRTVAAEPKAKIELHHRRHAHRHLHHPAHGQRRR